MSDTVGQFKRWYAQQPRALRLLITINVVVYLFWHLLFIHFQVTNVFFLTQLALNANFDSVLFHPWQLLTYSFLHLQPGLGGLLHILFNMLWLLWVGREYEGVYGPQRIVGIYVLGAIGGAVLTIVLHALLPGVSSFGGIVHGASGAVLALMTMVAIHQPEKRIGLMFIGVVRLIHVVIGFIALDFLFLSAGGTSVSAHLGGVLTGFICGKMILQGVDPAGSLGRILVFRQSGGVYNRSSNQSSGTSMLERMERWLASRNKNASSSSSKKKGHATIYQMDHAKKIEQSPSESDLNRILDKISASGYDSLSKAEKEMLLRESDS